MTRLIDADALNLNDLPAVYGSEGTWVTLEDVGKKIDTQPTIEAVPVRHGMWLPKHHYIAGQEFVSGHICSECGDDALNAEGDEFLTDYCPWCGARMDA